MEEFFLSIFNKNTTSCFTHTTKNFDFKLLSSPIGDSKSDRHSHPKNFSSNRQINCNLTIEIALSPQKFHTINIFIFQFIKLIFLPITDCTIVDNLHIDMLSDLFHMLRSFLVMLLIGFYFFLWRFLVGCNDLLIDIGN